MPGCSTVCWGRPREARQGCPAARSCGTAFPLPPATSPLEACFGLTVTPQHDLWLHPMCQAVWAGAEPVVTQGAKGKGRKLAAPRLRGRGAASACALHSAGTWLRCQGADRAPQSHLVQVQGSPLARTARECGLCSLLPLPRAAGGCQLLPTARHGGVLRAAASVR